MTSRVSLDPGPVTTLWLDRADKRNALDGALMRELAAAIDQVAVDAEARVLVLRGRGPVFSSGIDHQLLLDVMTESKKVPFQHVHHELQDTFHRMARLSKPVVAVLHGACVGMALELALAADVRLASADAVLGLPEVAFGIVPDVGGTTRLVRAVGEARARELILTGRMVRARTAERYGLVHEVADDAAGLDALVARRTAQLATHPPTALALAKTLTQASADMGTQTSFRLEGVAQLALLQSPDLAAQFPKALAFIKLAMANPD
ncbi:MAG TPA: enoyl-CoA hydratase/isomerase family protein [Kofleriaceae bacterium]|nr:enoyl-CoA hydratase/isomerase family protein [Kofleriaceae bacterium]